MSKLQLYSYWRSSSAWRVRIVLELKQIPYEVIPVHLVKDGGAQNKEAFSSKVNPMKQVPALVLPDGTVLTQSVAICEYLEEEPEYNAKTQPSLLPDDPTQRALVRKIVELVNSGIQPAQNLFVLNLLTELAEQKLGVDAEKKAELRQELGSRVITKGFDALEKELEKLHEKTPGEFVFGKQLTLADVFLVPQVYNAKRFKVDMDKYPLISKIEAHCATLSAFKKAHPSAQIDAE